MFKYSYCYHCYHLLWLLVCERCYLHTIYLLTNISILSKWMPLTYLKWLRHTYPGGNNSLRPAAAAGLGTDPVHAEGHDIMKQSARECLSRLSLYHVWRLAPSSIKACIPTRDDMVWNGLTHVAIMCIRSTYGRGRFPVRWHACVQRPALRGHHSRLCHW